METLSHLLKARIRMRAAGISFYKTWGACDQHAILAIIVPSKFTTHSVANFQVFSPFSNKVVNFFDFLFLSLFHFVHCFFISALISKSGLSHDCSIAMLIFSTSLRSYIPNLKHYIIDLNKLSNASSSSFVNVASFSLAAQEKISG
jgi:hypothetical protein